MDDEITQEGIESTDEDIFAQYLRDEQSETVDESPNEDTDDGETEDGKPEESEPELITVVIDGEQKQVTKEELVASYQKGAASTERFTEASRLKREAEAEKQQALQQRDQAIDVLKRYESQLEGYLLQPPKPELIDSNPAEYLRQQAAYQNMQQQYAQAQQKRSMLERQQFQELEQTHAQRLEHEAQRLSEVIPEWKDDKRAQEEKGQIKQYLQSIGYDDNAIAGVQDHREVVLVRKAMLYDNLIKKHRSGEGKVTPQAPRVERPGTTAKGKSNDAMKRLSKSGSTDDAAAVFFDMFKS